MSEDQSFWVHVALSAWLAANIAGTLAVHFMLRRVWSEAKRLLEEATALREESAVHLEEAAQVLRDAKLRAQGK